MVSYFKGNRVDEVMLVVQSCDKQMVIQRKLIQLNDRGQDGVSLKHTSFNILFEVNVENVMTTRDVKVMINPLSAV